MFVINTLAAWCSLLIFLFFTGELFMAWYGQNPYEWYVFAEHGMMNSWMGIIVVNCLSFILGLLLFFRKFRTNRLVTLLFFLSSAGFFFEKIVILVTSHYRDYLPTAWSLYREHIYARDLVAYAVIVFLPGLAYWWAKKKGRLPFPSVFLS